MLWLECRKAAGLALYSGFFITMTSLRVLNVNTPEETATVLNNDPRKIYAWATNGK